MLRATGGGPASDDTVSIGSAAARIRAYATGAGITSSPHTTLWAKATNAASALTERADPVSAGRITGFGLDETLHNDSAATRAFLGGTATNTKGRGQANG